MALLKLMLAMRKDLSKEEKESVIRLAEQMILKGKTKDYEDKQNTYYLDTFNVLKRIIKIVRAERFKNKVQQKTPISKCEIRMDSEILLSQVEQFIVPSPSQS